MGLLSCNNVMVDYDGYVATKNVTFTIEEGDYFCIVGENGSGKSTLMKAILGLNKISGGTVSYEGVKRTEIGYLPQQTVVQKDFPASVYEVVLSGCLNKSGLIPFYNKAQKERVSQAMKRLRIEELKRKSYRELSGGQQQRVLLARALCATEKLLLLDEPVTGLDPYVAKELYDLLEELNQKEKLTIIMISHDIKAALQYANKILHMKTEPLFYGSKEEYASSEIGMQLAGGEKNV